MLIADGWQLVFLRRNNIFRHALSREFAQQHAKWHLKAHEAPLQAVTIDCNKLLATIKRFEVTNRLYARFAAPLPHVEIIYEDDLVHETKHQATVDKICQHLAIPSAPIASTAFKRSTTDNLQNIIANYDEVVACMATTRYAHLL